MLEVDVAQKIDEFQQCLAKFKTDVDSGVTLHHAFVSIRASHEIDKLCPYLFTRL